MMHRPADDEASQSPICLGPTSGLGLKAQHYQQALACPSAGLWFEIHPENYMVQGGPRLTWLDAIRRDKPLSLHGVGLSLAADEPPDLEHLARLKRLADRYQPFVMSEHLAWSQRGGVYHPDLLPFPRTRRMLTQVADNIGRAQDALGRHLLIENPSLYLALNGHEMTEPEFLNELVAITGCGLLLDINNVVVSVNNVGGSASAYIDALSADAIGEIHLAGHAPDPEWGRALLIDTHAAPVCDSVWRLYGQTIGRIGTRPTLIERDGDIPSFEVLMAERDRANALMTSTRVARRA